MSQPPKETPKDKYVPVWEGVIENWTIKYSSSNVWRVIPHHDEEDLYQDGYWIFLKIKTKYPDVTDVRHFVSLYQRAFSNRLNDLSKTRTGEVGFKKFNSERMKEREELNVQRPFIDNKNKLECIGDALLFRINYISNARETTKERNKRVWSYVSSFYSNKI